jgi:hypothetical protein
VIWKGREVSYGIVQHSPSCVRAVAVGAACSHSGAVLPAGPAVVSEGEIRATENCVAGGELNPRPRLWYHARRHLNIYTATPVHSRWGDSYHSLHKAPDSIKCVAKCKVVHWCQLTYNLAWPDALVNLGYHQETGCQKDHEHSNLWASQSMEELDLIFCYSIVTWKCSTKALSHWTFGHRYNIIWMVISETPQDVGYKPLIRIGRYC